MDAILIDIAGVIHQSGEMIDGSRQAIERLRKVGVPFRMLTNTTSKSHRDILAMMSGFGIDVAPSHVMTAPTATASYLKKHELRPLLIINPAIEEEFASLDQTNANCVVLGDAGVRFDYANLNRAFRLLHADRSARLIAMGGNRFFRDSDGEDSLDILPFAKLLSAAAERDIITTGKPSPQFFQSAIDSMQEESSASIRKGKVTMIGDDIESDVGGAINSGISGILVRTGKYDSDEAARSKVQPTAVYDDLAKAVNDLLGKKTSQRNG